MQHAKLWRTGTPKLQSEATLFTNVAQGASQTVKEAFVRRTLFTVTNLAFIAKKVSFQPIIIHIRANFRFGSCQI